MADYGFTEDEATFFIDLADGKHHGDIVGLTERERWALGLDRSAIDDHKADAVSRPPVTSAIVGDEGRTGRR